jgi:hypothetical protein
MPGLDRLPPDQRAVLQLVLQRGRTYDDIAEMLSIDRAGVRERALGALDTLGGGRGSNQELDPARRGLITDYLLGQLPAAVADDVRRRFIEHPAERAWARVVASELVPIGAERLPEIPAAAPRAPEPVAAAPAPAPAERRGPRERRGPAQPIEFTDRRLGERRNDAPAGETARGSRLGGAILIGAVLAAIIAVVLVLALSGGSSKKHTSSTSTAASVTTTKSSTGSSTASAKPIAQVNLTSPSGGKTPAGAAIVVRQGTQTGLVIRAQGLPANTNRDAYAVWLTGPGGSPSQILGFVNPGVTKSGVLQTAGALPAGASKYKQLLVTMETQAKPKSPGKIVLQGTLSISG